MRAKRGAKEHGDAGGSVHATGAARLRLRRSDDVLSAFELQLSAFSCNGGKQPPFWFCAREDGDTFPRYCATYVCVPVTAVLLPVAAWVLAAFFLSPQTRQSVGQPTSQLSRRAMRYH